jgi:UTP--glucose-1-phosphate uridylyltransferase
MTISKVASRKTAISKASINKAATFNKATTISKAVFPIAGLGTRFLPATKASAKEMLAVVDKPLIQYAVEEAYEAGIRHMIFVTGRTKRSVEDHFDTAYELENELERAGKTDLLNVARGIAPDDMACTYVRQPRALGLGHAVLCARALIGREPFAVLLADDLMVGQPGILAQMIERFRELEKSNAQPASILAVQDVPRSETGHYGIVSGERVADDLVDVNGLVEKPAPANAPTTLGIAGRYLLTPATLDELESLPQGINGEIQLTDAIARLLRREKVYAYRYRGTRYDCGSKLGFLRATVDLAEQHAEVGGAFSNWLRDRNGNSPAQPQIP